MAKLMRLGWAAYGKMSTSLARQIAKGGKDFDLVIGIARGGIPLAMVISDELGLKIDIINVKSYTGIGKTKRSAPRILSTLTNDINGKRILLVDDLIENGDTMHTVIGYLKLSKPVEVCTAALFKKPWSKFKPDYYVKTVDKWVVFPWEVGELRRADQIEK